MKLGNSLCAFLQTTFPVLVFMALFGACQKNETPTIPSSSVYSETGDVDFEELVLLVRIKAADSLYVVANSVLDIRIFVNDFFWTEVNSQPIDTERIPKVLSGNTYVTTEDLNYLVLASASNIQTEYYTAGDYAEYLNGQHVLQPGEYACYIESFKLKHSDGIIRKYYPMEYTIFKVEENSRSAFGGEIELNIEI